MWRFRKAARLFPHDKDLYILQIADSFTGIQASILPVHGAILHEFSIPFRGRRIQVISQYTDRADLEKNQLSYYRSAKLSPFVCRIAGGRYQYQGKTYEFENKFQDGSAIHGILSDKAFTVVRKSIEQHEASVELRYEYNLEDAAYPFKYAVNITYTLKEKGELILKTVVQNNSAESIPMADGWHPYFQMEGESDDWLLSFRSSEMLLFDEKLIPLGQTVTNNRFLSPRQIGNDSLDNAFILEPRAAGPAAVLENPMTGLSIQVYPDKNYPYLQIFTPDDRKSIAIENLSSAPDAFNNHLGLLIMEPGSSQTFSVAYQLQFR